MTSPQLGLTSARRRLAGAAETLAGTGLATMYRVGCTRGVQGLARARAVACSRAAPVRDLEP